MAPSQEAQVAGGGGRGGCIYDLTRIVVLWVRFNLILGILPAGQDIGVAQNGDLTSFSYAMWWPCCEAGGNASNGLLAADG